MYHLRMRSRTTQWLLVHVIACYASHAFFILIALLRSGWNGDPLVASVAFLLAPLSYPVAMVAGLIWPDKVGPDNYWFVVGYILTAAATYVAMRGQQRLPVAAG